MMIVTFHKIRNEIEQEMNLAEAARKQGREGRARVCARRAAGQAIAVFHQRKTGIQPQANYYRLLCWFQEVDDVPDALKQAAARLTTRVTPEYTLPHPHDPLQDARLLIEALLTEDEDHM
jgi:hypothetical protein